MQQSSSPIAIIMIYNTIYVGIYIMLLCYEYNKRHRKVVIRGG